MSARRSFQRHIRCLNTVRIHMRGEESLMTDSKLSITTYRKPMIHWRGGLVRSWQSIDLDLQQLMALVQALLPCRLFRGAR